jgi:hypothetical protein
MRRIAVLVVCCLALPVCSDDPVTSGVRGVVRVGPMCPVEVAGSPCPPGPWSGTVRATSSDGEVHEVTTDDAGSFSLPLPPGDYVVVAVTDPPSPTGIPLEVTVSDGSYVTADLQVDSGIR